MTRRSFPLAFLWMIALAGTLLAASADELGEVTRLQHAGQSAAALERADQFLAAHPRDAQMRFLKAAILGDAGRSMEAVAVLEQLTEDYPGLAEPHNNLATLYAARGDYVKARAALEQALRLKPDYVTAHENLGDVYAALAGQSYATALRLDPDRASVPAKLALLRPLAASNAARPSPPAAAAAPAASR
ncbi:MAG TPA: tetratricopeptide repeat protein [Caldimonas sp.]